MQATYLPAIEGARNSSRTSSVPKRARAGVAISVCTAIAIGMAPQLMWPKRLAKDGGVGIVEAEAAEFLGLGDAEEARLSHLAEHVVGGEGRVFFPFVDVRVDLRFDETDERAAQFFVLGGEFHIAVSSWCAS